MSLFRALRYKNYRLFFAGQGISLVGTWMQSVAISWITYRITNSAALLGVVGFASQISGFLLAPVSGVFVDRWDKKKILMTTQTLAMAQAFLLALLAYSSAIKVWNIVLLSVFLGMINAFDMPCRHSFIVQMIGKKSDLGNAIALNSLLFNSARFIGPPIAGLLISASQERLCFLINGLTYVAVIFALFIIRVKEEPAKKNGKVLIEFKEGLDYALRQGTIKDILILFAVVNFLGASCMVLMPVYVKEVLKSGPSALGFLVGSLGFGALIGALYAASKEDAQNLKRRIPFAAALFGAALVIFSFSRIFWLSMLLFAIAGFGLMIEVSSSNTVIQHLTEDDKRGRVMGLYTMVFLGTITFGSLSMGYLASKIGIINTLFTNGILCLIAVFIWGRKLMEQAVLKKPLYQL